MLTLLRNLPRSVCGVLLLALLVRAGCVLWQFDELSVDRDAYLAIGKSLAEGFEFSSIPGKPTGFRPPLYPLLVAACHFAGGTVALGIVQALLGTATVLLTALLSRNLGLSRLAQSVAALFVALDPLLIQYTARPMTETLCVFLVTGLLLIGARLRRDSCSKREAIPDQDVSPNRTTWPGPVVGLLTSRVLIGVLFGLVVLCRPGLWPFGFLAGFVWLLRLTLRRSTLNDWRLAGCVVAGVVFTVAPWTVRNVVVFGRPIVMTTHGGYTLLLGNNPVFYSEVVSQRGDRVWTGESLAAWQTETGQRLAAAGIDPRDEVANDAALGAEARRWIAAHPTEFLEAVGLRLRRFWAFRPSTDVGAVTGAIVGFWYAGLFGMALTGAIFGKRLLIRNPELVLLVLSLTLVHSVYWSNTRMRAPVVPVLAVFGGLAVAAVNDRFRARARRQGGGADAGSKQSSTAGAENSRDSGGRV